MKEDLITVYFKNYKPYILATAMFLVSVFILFNVIMPQWTSIQSKNDEIAQKNHDVDGLKASFQTINELNKGDIDSSLKLVDGALPNGKNILAIYNAITTVASASNVNINDFSIKIGDLINSGPGTSTSVTDSSNSADKSSQTLEVQLDASSSDTKNLFTFSNNLYKVLPLAEIKTLEASQGDSKIDILFYYEPYNAAAIAKKTIVAPLTTDQQQLMKLLTSWQTDLQQQATLSASAATPTPVASGSATPSITRTPTVSPRPTGSK